VRKITALQLKKFSRKGCPLYYIQILKLAEGKELRDDDHPVLWEYRDIFLEEVLGIPPKRDLDFPINLVLGAVPTSNILYKMRTPELVELKM